MRGGGDAGQRLLATFNQVVIPTSCADPDCTASYVVNGTIDDGFTKPVDLDYERLPFGTVGDDNGPPERSGLIVALEMCSSIDTAFMARKIGELGDVLAEESKRLEIIERREDAASFSFVIPKKMLHSAQDLPINITDVRTLKAAIDLESAAHELVSQYKHLEGALQPMIKNRDVYDDTGSTAKRVRDFDPMLLAMNYAMNLLAREEGFEIETFRTRLDRSLSSASAALRNAPADGVDGILNFRSLPSRRLADELADGVDAVRSSITSLEPILLPSAPLYRFHLKTFFDNPLDRDRLLMLTGLMSLVHFEPGNSSQPTALEKNNRVVYDLLCLVEEGSTSWLGGLLELPPDRSTLPCDQCGDGYGCIDGRCEAELPWALTPGALESTLRDDWPSFANPVLRQLLGL
jgi:hypothetical protein